MGSARVHLAAGGATRLGGKVVLLAVLGPDLTGKRGWAVATYDPPCGREQRLWTATFDAGKSFYRDRRQWAEHAALCDDSL